MAVTPIGEKAFWSSHIKTVGTPDVMNMGTGPFEFSSFNPATGVTLTRNPNYWGRKASFKTLKIDFISDPNTMLLAMRSGEIQGTFKVPFPQIAQYKQLPGVNVQTASAETPGYLSLDVSDPPFSDTMYVVRSPTPSIRPAWCTLCSTGTGRRHRPCLHRSSGAT